MAETYPGTEHQLPPDDLALEDYYSNHGVGAFSLPLLRASENTYAIDGNGDLLFSTYELSDSSMEIRDVVWGECTIDATQSPFDELLLRLARTPLFRRLQSIEQLTLGEEYATMPNTMYFSRWQHIWGSLVFVRKMTEDTSMDPHEREVMQLRTLLSDVGHTSFSHLGDWLFQDDGKENLHDQDLREILNVSGIANLLDTYGYSLNETVFPEVHDWVECPSPNLCVDRVDYGLREILRWGVPTIPLHMYLSELKDPKKLFAIDDQNRLTITNPTFAKLFAAGYSLLPTEHWSHPVHRLQLELLQMATRSAVVTELDSGGHPREALYGIDADFGPAFNGWPLLQLNKTLKDIARTQRQIFVAGRRSDLNTVLRGIEDPDWQFPDFPDPLTSYSWQSKEFDGPYPPNVIIEPAPQRLDPLSVSSQGLAVYLPALKARAVDPLVGSGDTAVPLSTRESNYGPYLEGQRRIMAASHLATICMRGQVAERLVRKDAETRAKWARQLKRPRNPENLRRTIEDAQYLAGSLSFDNILEV